MKLRDLFRKRAKMPPGIQRAASHAKGRSSPEGSSSLAVVTLLPLGDNGQRNLAFGLVWRPLVSQDSKTVQDNARRIGATHAVTGGNVLGLGKLLSKTKAEYFAAAMVAAQTHRSAAIYALSLGDDRVWVAQTRGSGVPTGEDQILRVHEALEKVRQWRQDNAGSDLYTDVPDTGFEDAKVWGLADLATSSMPVSTALKPVGKGSSLGRMWSSLPASLKLLGGVLLLGLVSMVAWDSWKAYEARERAAKARAQALNENPELLWQQALAKELMQRAAPDAKNWSSLRQSLGRLPTRWVNWPLKTATCTAAALAASRVTWQCTAQYDAPEAAKAVATNNQLLQAKPDGFDAVFLPTKQALLKWSVVVELTALQAKTLPARDDHLIGTASRIQSYFPSLGNPPVMNFVPMKVAAPVRADGTSIAPPASLRLPVESTLTVTGPLRSLDEMLAKGVPADWKRLVLTYTSNAQAAAKSSVLMAELQGVMYASN